MTVTTIADANHNPVTKTVNINVVKVDSTLTVDGIVFDYAGSGSAAVSFTGAIGVTAQVVNHPEAVVNVKDNKITVSNLNAGNYTLTVTTIANANHNPVTKTVNVTVNKVDSTLTVDDVILDYGETADLAVEIDGATGVVAKINDVDAVVTGNVIAIPLLDAGNYTLTVTTIADANHNPVTKTANVNVIGSDAVSKANATFKTANKVIYGNYLTMTFVDLQGNPISNATVTVDLGGAKTYVTDENGQIRIATKGVVPKTYTAKVEFMENDNYNGFNATPEITVLKATPKITAKAKTFKSTDKTKKYTVTLKDNKGKALKNKWVYLKVNGKTYKAKTNSKGQATFKLKKLAKIGNYKALITYNGNDYYKKVTKKVNLKVKFVTVCKGSKRHELVKKIQRALKNHGYYLVYNGHYLMVDGIFWDYTEMAVKEFQNDKVLKVTGKVDEKTAKKLGII